MTIDPTALERALGAIGTTFRLSRLYPATHPAVQESLRQISAALPGLAALGTLEWKIGATGLHWHGQHLLPRNTQVAELSELLFAHGVRAIQVNPGLTPEHVLALFAVATGHIPADDPSLGRIALLLGRRSQRVAVRRAPAAKPPPAIATAAPPAEAKPSPPPPAPQSLPPPPPPAPGHSPTAPVFRPDVVPPDVEARRAVVALRDAKTGEEQHVAVEKLEELVKDVLGLRDLTVVAEVIAVLDEALPKVQEAELIERLGALGTKLVEPALVDRMVKRLAEARVPPAERSVLVRAVGALASVAIPSVLEAFRATPAELREPYRAAIRVAADRALEPLQARLADKNEAVVAAAAEFLGLTGSPQAVPVLVDLVHHRADVVREAALHAMAELGGRDVTRPAMPALKDESAHVRAAAARVIGLGGEASATTVLARRLEQEEDEGVLAEMLKAVGRLGAKEALEILARYADPGGRGRRPSAHVRAAAVEGLGHLKRAEARALLELYNRDKDPSVQRAAEAALK
jgi:HEAT repeat protein